MQRLHGLDAVVSLVVNRELPADWDDVRPDAVHALAPAADGRGPAFRRALSRADAATRLWLYAGDDEWVDTQAARASIIFAIDERSVFTANNLAQTHRRAVVVTTLDDAVRHLARPATRSIRLPSLPRPATLAGALPPWAASALAGWPWMAENRRYENARSSSLALLRRGHPARANRVVSRALKRLQTPRLRADLLGDITNAALAEGQLPALTRDAYAAELAVADLHLAEGLHQEAAESFVEAARIAFHRVLHFDHLTSPLAADPAGYTLPLRESTTAQALSAPRGRAIPANTPPQTRPTRLLIATRTNAYFLTEIREYLSEHRDFEVQFVDFGPIADLDAIARNPTAIAAEILDPTRAVSSLLEERLRPHLDWADVVFVEWCASLAVLMTLIDPGDTRIVVRLHSYEAFTQWPHLVDFTRVDDLVFVSDHLRDMAVSAIPALSHPDASRVHVLPNALALRGYLRAKPDAARFTLALVGWSQIAKDPRWAIDVVRLLRAQDDRYRLLLIGPAFAEGHSAATRAYGEDLKREIAELEQVGGLTQFGFTDDVAAALVDVGVILSSSVRESFHAGLVEGAASGAVPIVRDWPFFAGKTQSVRQLFPPEWVVGTPAEAAARILETTASDANWRASGRAASDHVISQWDWDRVKLDYAALLRSQTAR